jgi:hypothetical protein
LICAKIFSVATPSDKPKPRNLQTQALNRRESWWQIYVPLGAAVLAALVCMGLTIASAYGAQIIHNRPWADVSLIYLIILAAIGVLPVLALMVGLCFGAWYVLRELPAYFKIVQDFMQTVANRAAEISRRVANVFIAPRASAAAAQKALNRTRSIILPRRKA